MAKDRETGMGTLAMLFWFLVLAALVSMCSSEDRIYSPAPSELSKEEEAIRAEKFANDLAAVRERNAEAAKDGQCRYMHRQIDELKRSNSYDKSKFIQAVKAIRLLTIKDPEEFTLDMLKLCAESGVALALVPEMKKVPWHGATKWLSASKAMVLLNLRGKNEDQFWFSFFHEAGHVLHDSKKDLYINDGTGDDPLEQKANEFSAQTLIPRNRDPEIVSLRTKAEVVRLADELEISPGIVVGRFQHLTKKWNTFNGLKRKFEWTNTGSGL